jgi:hypothetical protein
MPSSESTLESPLELQAFPSGAISISRTSIRAGSVEEFVQAVESNVIGFVFPASGEAGGNSEEKGRHEKAGNTPFGPETKILI